VAFPSLKIGSHSFFSFQDHFLDSFEVQKLGIFISDSVRLALLSLCEFSSGCSHSLGRIRVIDHGLIFEDLSKPVIEVV